MMKLTIEEIRKAFEMKAKPFIPKHYFLKLMKVSLPTSYDNEYGECHYDLEFGSPVLEGTRKEHWSPRWEQIVSKYLLEDGSTIIPEDLPFDTWVSIQTNPDIEVRKKSVTWMVPPLFVAKSSFEINGLIINPSMDLLCCGGDETAPNLDWGCWPVKIEVFSDTYAPL